MAPSVFPVLLVASALTLAEPLNVARGVAPAFPLVASEGLRPPAPAGDAQLTAARDLPAQPPDFAAPRPEANTKEDVPVAPAMRCVSVLVILYFSVYLTLVIVRSWGKLVGFTSQGVPGKVEEVFMEATEALSLVPMLCVLMIAARLRAHALDPAVGNPQPWAQVCMYISTWALLISFLVQLFEPCVTVPDRHTPRAKKALFWVIWGIRLLLALVIYGGCTAILVSIFAHAAPTGATPPMSPMLQCIVTLGTLYFAIYLLLGIAQFRRRALAAMKPSHRRRDADEADPGVGPVERREAEAWRQHGVERVLEQASLTLHFAPMLSILLGAIALRELQLGVEHPMYANIAMYIATWAIAVKVLIVVLVPNLLPGEMVDVQEDTRGIDWAKQSHPTLRCIAICLTASWRLTVFLLYGALVTVIVSIFVSESRPHELLWPDVWDGKSVGLAALRVAGRVPPLSTAMRCVITLTVLYFAIYLIINLGRTFTGEKSRQRFAYTLAGVEHSLAFAPMLCVLMVTVRMRAIQLCIRDPQAWAQVMMYCATGAVLVQVTVAVIMVWLDPTVDDDDDAAESSATSQIWLKGALVCTLILRYIAATCLYVAMGALIVALFSMESDPLQKWDIRPDLRGLSGGIPTS